MPCPENLRPTVVSTAAQSKFEEQARLMRLDPSSIWVGGYVDYEWDHLRHVLESLPINLADLKVLEFGCNVGASAILCAHLGATVSAVDVSDEWITLARFNADRYGLRNIDFSYVPDTRVMPFADQQFDIVICNSVLEYVEIGQLAAVQCEIDRILSPGGIILLTGTSNRLWPKEVHSRKWLVNYLPRAIDRLSGKPLERGIWPWTARYGFGGNYSNLDTPSRESFFIRSRLLMGTSHKYLRLLLFVASLLRIGPGMLAQNISCLLKKNHASTSANSGSL